MSTVRTRFAPSPTGFLHVGGLRTALYAYLWAKKNNGKFLLRIEDTDRTRLVAGATENIISTLHWAGIDFDEGPGKPGVCESYIQSERLPLYQKYAQQLIDAGHAYYCFCSSERLEEVRNRQIALKLPPAYDKSCRNLTPAQVAQKKEEHPTCVVRMKVPEHGEMTFNDIIRGDVTFGYKVVDDQVLMKSDGYPTYHLAVVVDDHDMQISHVIRGEEWLSSTPKHILLYQYFGWNIPLFAHLPLMLNPDRSKLSKRQGDVAVEDYRDKGYLPEALVNFIAFLGWNPGDTREIFSLPELVQEFSLERVGKSGAVFNVEKLQWLNQQYILKMPADAILKQLRPVLEAKGFVGLSDEYVTQIIELLKDRVTFIHEYVIHGSEFFGAPQTYDETFKAKCWKPETSAVLKELSDACMKLDAFDAVNIEKALRDFAVAKGVGAGSLIMPMRLAIAGLGQGANLFQVMAIIGKKEVAARVQKACDVFA